MSKGHNVDKQNWIESSSDQYITRWDKPDEPLYCGPGSSVHSPADDVSSGTKIGTYDTPAATTMDYSGPEFDDNYWGRLDQWHNGNAPNWDGYGQENHENAADKFHRIDKGRIAEAVCSALDLNVGETGRVVYEATKMNYSQFGYHRAMERVILGIIAVVVEDRRIQRGADLYTASIQRHEAFKSLMTKFGIDSKDLNLIKRIVRRQISGSDHGAGIFNECVAA
ncbi:hypothetical protein [Haloferax sp. Atlit-6N]|uniref:hypothetical protein n=1 Tax=Haloferax sp. Atlit-6N TaxID=2077205 RepID=UPI0011C05619|nr:hypothetical protein [Haloferax sp. Atlit-6N]